MIFNKIKLNYNLKLIDDLFKSKDFNEIKNILAKNLNSNHYLNIVDHVLKNHLSYQKNTQYFTNKFVWISSYNLEDTTYLNDFLVFYLKKEADFSYNLDNYQNQISHTFEKIKDAKFPKHISFDDVVNFSHLYQFLLLDRLNKDVVFSNSSSAFFEAGHNRFLIFPHTTSCSFYVIRDPYDLYHQFKNKFNNSQEALNELLDLNNIEPNKKLTYSITENRQSWSINAKSWTNKNVQNTYRGKTLKYENFLNSPTDILTEVVYHLKQSGLNINIDFNTIDEFVEKNKLAPIHQETISNKERKMITNSLDNKLLEEFGYQVND